MSVKSTCLVTVDVDGVPSQYTLRLFEESGRRVVTFDRTDGVTLDHLTQSFPITFLGGSAAKILREALTRSTSQIGKVRCIHHMTVHIGDREIDLVEPFMDY